MNDSRDFQDAESVRSRHSHVTSQPVSFPPHPIPGGMLSRSKGMPSRREGPPSIWDTHGISGNVFAGSHIEVSQEKAIEELDEIPVERNTKEDLHCTPVMHARYTSFLGQINWLQRGTQLQLCYKFSSCASMAASPTIGDVKALNKLARQLKSQPVKLQIWPLTGPWRILGFLDASYRNNEDGSSQRA